MEKKNDIHEMRRSLAAVFCQTCFALMLFFIGGLIYIVFRAETIRMFIWADYLGLSNWVNRIRTLCEDIYVNDFIRYSVPDGLWLLAYLLIIDIIWNESNIFKTAFIYVLPIIAILLEFMQLFGLFHGVFDIYDLISYFGALLIYKLLKI